MTKTISKSELSARMLELLSEVEATGEELIVTDHGQPVLRMVLIQEKASVSDPIAGLQGRVLYHEDADAPTAGEWSES